MLESYRTNPVQPSVDRGHCIMVLDVVMPDPEDTSMKKRGRIYVCDLAGTEPAGDIFYTSTRQENAGRYNRKTFNRAHRDTSRTKELQDQGKKINLSLSEMAVFMKMADSFKKEVEAWCLDPRVQ